MTFNSERRGARISEHHIKLLDLDEIGLPNAKYLNQAVEDKSTALSLALPVRKIAAGTAQAFNPSVKSTLVLILL